MSNNKEVCTKRLVIYARGRLLKKNVRKINWKVIIAVIDKSGEKGEIYEGVPVFSPDKLRELEYDYIAVFSNVLFDNIYSELSGIYLVPAEKIISWRLVVDEEADRLADFSYVQKFLQSSNADGILDSDSSHLFHQFLTKESLGIGEVRLDGIGSNTYPIIDNLYDHIYDNIHKVDMKAYDLVLLWGLPNKLEDVGEILCAATGCMVVLGYRDVMGIGIQNAVGILKQYGDVQMLQSSAGCFLELRRKSLQDILPTHIYVVTHKEYNVIRNELYKPICVGDKYFNHEYISEKTGDNISYLNEKINECTALYWIWKNTKARYVGLNHYRRYFCNNNISVKGNILQADRINEILKDHDILLSNMRMTENVLEEIRVSVGNDEIFRVGLELVTDGIRKHSPDYLEAFENVMNGRREYICNLFVTKREILNMYCEWLFSFLIDAAEKIDVSEVEGNSKRVMGFFAERLLTVWLLKQKIRIKELPILKL